MSLVWVIPYYHTDAQPGKLIFEKVDVRPGFIVSEKQYTETSLWGYSNGGADLYLEYGFSQLNHQEIAFRGLLFKADIYEMRDSLAAFGVYSISSRRCQDRSLLKYPNCVTLNQIQFAVGKYYVSITNIRGDTSALRSSIDLSERLLKQYNYQSYIPPSIFQSGLLEGYQDELKVIYGPLGLQNGYPDWSERFEGMKDYFITLLPIGDTAGSIQFARIIFSQPEDLIKFRESAGMNTSVNSAYYKKSDAVKSQALIILDDISCLYLEAFKKHEILDNLLEAMDKVGLKAGEGHDSSTPK